MSKSNADSLADFGQAVLDLFIASFVKENGNTSGADFVDRVGQLGIEHKLMTDPQHDLVPDKPKAKKPNLMPPEAWTNLSRERQQQLAYTAKPLDVWRNRYSGKLVTVHENINGFLRLRHTKGATARRWYRYFVLRHWPVALEGK